MLKQIRFKIRWWIWFLWEAPIPWLETPANYKIMQKRWKKTQPKELNK